MVSFPQSTFVLVNPSVQVRKAGVVGDWESCSQNNEQDDHNKQDGQQNADSTPLPPVCGGKNIKNQTKKIQLHEFVKV